MASGCGGTGRTPSSRPPRKPQLLPPGPLISRFLGPRLAPSTNVLLLAWTALRSGNTAPSAPQAPASLRTTLGALTVPLACFGGSPAPDLPNLRGPNSPSGDQKPRARSCHPPRRKAIPQSTQRSGKRDLQDFNSLTLHSPHTSASPRRSPGRASLTCVPHFPGLLSKPPAAAKRPEPLEQRRHLREPRSRRGVTLASHVPASSAPRQLAPGWAAPGRLGGVSMATAWRPLRACPHAVPSWLLAPGQGARTCVPRPGTAPSPLSGRRTFLPLPPRG
ncbi:protein transport protein sec31-like [Heterocephalus glaber]|uniref:Protein transport protein sec31-like n=1 Tax=Heterocephalus glaber TaxID=10181 RepID=A0AAX6Q536_HETGA|nr:protein transport protein sec31-like [Heterocephalus glaber]